MSQSLFCIKRVIHTVTMPLRLLYGKRAPDVEHIAVFIDRLPAAFEGYTMAVLADLHFPDNLSTPVQILTALHAAAPDCILLPGDITNRYNRSEKAALTDLLQQFAAIAPCYAITGNHEQTAAYLPEYRTMLQAAGVHLVEDCAVSLTRGNAALPLFGICDPKKAVSHVASPSLLLLHYPHQAMEVCDRGFSLAICGHAHGGQIRFGKHRALYAPGQGFFPQYTGGLYTMGKMQTVISRGLGDSSLPVRINNAPHLPVITLHCR